MTEEQTKTPVFEDLQVGAKLKAFRRAKSLSLSDLSKLTMVSEATLSRVENEQTPVSAHNLYILSQALGVDITSFFADSASPIRNGVRSISRRSEQTPVETARYLSSVLCTDLANKKMHPAVNIVEKKSVAEVGGLASHPGEEFLYVLSGKLVLHTDFYAPLLLEEGDSIYFDGMMAHAYIAGGDEPAQFLVATTVDSKFSQVVK
jgi:transcriptional regulator with XRE-family HTH domain